MNSSHPVRKNSVNNGNEKHFGPGDPESEGESVDPSTYEFEKLAGAANCIHIRCGPNLYTLRKTRTGGLVLNK